MPLTSSVGLGMLCTAARVVGVLVVAAGLNDALERRVQTPPNTLHLLQRIRVPAVCDSFDKVGHLFLGDELCI